MERPKHLSADERRAVTVKAVVALAAQQNPSEITTAAIAQHMNLTQGALFRHFPNKEAIWQAVMEWVSDHLMKHVAKSAQEVSPLDALEATFMGHVDFVARHPGVPRMIFGELQRAEDTATKRVVQTLIRRYGQHVRSLVDAGKAQGLVAKEIDTAAAATLFIGTIQGLVMQSMLAGKVQRIRTEAPGAFAIYRRGLEVAS